MLPNRRFLNNQSVACIDDTIQQQRGGVLGIGLPGDLIVGGDNDRIGSSVWRGWISQCCIELLPPLQHPQTILEQASMLEFVVMYAVQRRFAALLLLGFWVSQLLWIPPLTSWDDDEEWRETDQTFESNKEPAGGCAPEVCGVPNAIETRTKGKAT